MGKLTITRPDIASVTFLRPFKLLLGMALVSSAVAQSSANFGPSPGAPAAPREVVASAKPAPAAADAPVTGTPSRHINTAELGSYVDSVAAVFMIRGRTRDSFGQNQDPDAKPVVKVSPTLAVRRAPAQATPFSDIVRLLVVTTIMPGEKRFLVGTRSFKQGDTIPLTFRNKPIRALITEVTSRRISFRNVDTGEDAIRALDMLPEGMKIGSSAPAAPGMVPDRPNAPIDLEAADPVSSNTIN